jgi:preprotein translocase subunit SecG
MRTTLEILLYIDAILLIFSILVQQRGTGLSATFGGGGGFFKKKRGPEKVLFNASIVFAVIFVLLSLLIPFSEKLATFLGIN